MFVMGRLLLAVLVSTAACNAAFGLDGTEVIVDEDGDGVSDRVDNCPELANPSQDDADEDGLGDPCDGCDHCQPCDHGVGHDEDRDAIDDGCDSCPALANPEQANADGDDLGDVCDATPLLERRLLFDGFGRLGADWLQGGSRWVITDGDDVGPEAPGMPNVTSTLQPSSVTVTGGSRWRIEVGLVTPGLDRSVTLFVNDMGFCKLDHLATGEWKLTATGTWTAPFTATFPPTIRLQLTPAGPTTAPYVACTIPDVISISDTHVAQHYPLSPKLVAIYDGPQFRYLEIIGE